MDPSNIQAFLIQAAFVELKINGGTFAVMELTETELDLMKKRNLKSNEAQVARRYHKIMELVSELEALAQRLPAKRPKIKRTGRTTVDTAGEEEDTSHAAEWSLVPFKPKVPPPTVRFTSSALKWSTKQLQMAVVPDAVRRVGPHVWWCYKQVFGLIWLLLLLTPMLVLYAVIWILMAAGVHMVNHPEASISVWRSRSPIT